MQERNHSIYRFGKFELDPAERRLSAVGKPIALTPKVFDTLVLLVERAGRLVSKDELMRALWPRGYVEESNLTKHIWVIRRALGDGEHGSSFIETVPKLGYRFVATVTTGQPVDSTVATVAAPAPVATASEPIILPPPPRLDGATLRPSHRTGWIIIGITAVTLALASLWLWRPAHRASVRPADGAARTIAIMGGPGRLRARRPREPACATRRRLSGDRHLPGRGVRGRCAAAHRRHHPGCALRLDRRIDCAPGARILAPVHGR